MQKKYLIVIDSSRRKITVFAYGRGKIEKIKQLTLFSKLFPHYKDIRKKHKKAIKKIIPKRLEKVKNLIERLFVTIDVEDIWKEIKPYLKNAKIILDPFSKKKLKRFGRIEATKEDKKRLKHYELIFLNIVDNVANLFREELETNKKRIKKRDYI